MQTQILIGRSMRSDSDYFVSIWYFLHVLLVSMVSRELNSQKLIYNLFLLIDARILL